MSNSSVPQMSWVTPQKLDDRMDAKPFQKHILSRLDKVQSCGIPTKKICSPEVSAFLSRGVNGATNEEQKTRLYKSRHIRTGFIEADSAYLPDEKADRLGKKKLKKGDALLTSTGLGTIGRSAIYTSVSAATVDNHISIVRPNEGFNSGYLVAYLNSTYGQAWSDFGTTGSTGQLELSKDKVGSIRVPVPDKEIQDYIGAKIEKSQRLLDLAKSLIEEAKEDTEALIEGRLDSDAILSGKVKAISWDDIQKELEGI